MCIAVGLAVIVLGKSFGGSLKGLIPLAACLVSGIWLWMKEVIRSGREVEWESEKERGRTVSENLTSGTTQLTQINLGHRQSPP